MTRATTASSCRQPRRMTTTLAPAADPEGGKSSVERTARESEDTGGLADIAALGRERPLDQIALDLVERHLLEARRPTFRAGTQHQVIRRDLATLREQRRTLDDVLELA